MYGLKVTSRRARGAVQSPTSWVCDDLLSPLAITVSKGQQQRSIRLKVGTKSEVPHNGSSGKCQKKASSTILSSLKQHVWSPFVIYLHQFEILSGMLPPFVAQSLQRPLLAFALYLTCPDRAPQSHPVDGNSLLAVVADTDLNC